jgi:uncharacterized protein
MGRWRVVLLALALLAPVFALAQGLQPVPALNAHVVDQTGTLNAAQRDALENKLAAFEREKGTQVVVVLVPTTQPEDITDYTQRLGDAWKIGRRQVGDGVLLVVAKNDHAVRIAPAKALEGAVPDVIADRIIEDSIVPAFRAGDFAGGLNAALDQLFARIRGEALPAPSWQHAPQRQARHANGPDWSALLMFFFIGVPVIGGVLSAMLGRRLGSFATALGAGVLASWLGASIVLGVVAGVVALVLVGVLGLGTRPRGIGGLPIGWGGGGWSGGGGGWGGGGGGFSSGGGGDFGGGGASGRW